MSRLRSASFALLGLVSIGCTRLCSDATPARKVLPAELADHESLALFANWQELPLFRQGRREKQSTADRETGARPEIPLWDHGNRDMNNFVCRSADADAPASRVPFIYDQPECTEPYVHGVILGRFDGPGRLARLWLTAASFRDRPPDREVLRIWIDDAATPIVDVPLREAMDGSAGEMFAPPFGNGSTRRMAWYYPLVFSKKLVVAIDGLGDDDLYFHQVDVVVDSSKARPIPSSRLPERSAALQTLRSPPAAPGSKQSRHWTLAKGETARVFEHSGPGTIVKTSLRVAEPGWAALSDVFLEAHWDDSETPAIQLPILALFAAFDAAPEPSSSLLGSRRVDGAVELWLALPMPFRKHAVWTLENRGEAPADLDLTLVVTSTVPSRSWGHLEVQRFETNSAGPSAHPIAKQTGRGRLVGACLSMHGHGGVEGDHRGHPMSFLEGDEKLVVDSGKVLSGTGTEDYFNSSFFFDDGPAATPFAQVWAIRSSPAGGQVSACRWHVLSDAIDFDSALELTLEVGPGLPETLDRYRSVAFLYR